MTSPSPLLDLLQRHETAILSESFEGMSRCRLVQYQAAGADEVKRRLARLLDLLVAAVRDRDLDPVLSYARGTAAERFAEGIDLHEVQSAINVLASVAEHGELPKGFVKQLLEVREVLAPAYAREAVRHAPVRVAAFLAGAEALGATAQEWTRFDWELHHLLAVASGNPVYTLILNGFRGLYARMALLYFERPAAREASKTFYGALRLAAAAGDAPRAERVTRDVMARSVELWRPLERRLAKGRAR